MSNTLVLAVDRDDDFGVKGNVNTPVIGIEGCISAASALAIADPEDSDTNALYAAISTCKDLRNDGIDAEVALICGDEKVGHKSDLALIDELEEVMDIVQPEHVVLIGDGAEDEYIYPIISSRSNVDSVKKVFVKQAPNIESSFYIVSKMLSEPSKRRRFVAPLGIIVFLLSLALFVPDFVLLIMNGDLSLLPSLSRDFVLMVTGIIILMYAYSFSEKWSRFAVYMKEKLLSRSIKLIMAAISVGIILIALIMAVYEISDTFFGSLWAACLYFCMLMAWPAVFAIMANIVGVIIDQYQDERVLRVSNIFDCVGLLSIGFVIMGLLDLMLNIVYAPYDGSFGIVEIIIGIMISLTSSFIQDRYRPVLG